MQQQFSQCYSIRLTPGLSRAWKASACRPVLGVSQLLLLSLSLIAKHMALSEPRMALEKCAGCACAVARRYCVGGNPALIAETLSAPAILQIGCEKSACRLGTGTNPS